jgi:galactokinase
MLDISPIHRKEYETDASATVVAAAPGRVHYLGKHGEPKAGLFLSSAIDRYIRVAVSARKDTSLRFYAADLGERKRTSIANLKYKREDRWANYVKVAIHIFAELGFVTKGLNFTISGNIPQSIGLASSSAIEVAAITALCGFFNAPFDNNELLSRLIEAQETFFERTVDPVDYVVAFFAQEGHFLIVDELNLSTKIVKSPLDKYKILIMDSKVPRFGEESELKERRHTIKKALDLLSKQKEDATFRDFMDSDMLEYVGGLPEELRRRSTHVVQELRRVDEAEIALNEADFPSLSKIIFHSHESLRDLYEVSCPEIDWLVKRAQEAEGILGSRMTGQGFGGCTYAIIEESACEEYLKRLEDYERIFGFRPIVYEVKLAQGARLL